MIPQFALRLIFGMSLTWCLLPRREVTSGFYRIQMLVTLGLSVLASLTLSHLNSEDTVHATTGFYSLVITLAVGSFIGSVMWTLERRAAGLRYALAVLLGAAGGLVLVTRAQHSITPAWFEIVSQLSSGWLIGSAISTMLLGHWYLTATGMPLRPLQQFNTALLLAVVFRIMTAAMVLMWVNWPPETSQKIWLSLRWAGLIGPLVLTWLVFRVLKYRNTQSATGVLYAVDILIFLGEATAALLTRDLLAPF